MDNRLDLLSLEENHIPKRCGSCGGVMVFKGVGEYECEDCGELAYDDYGKVRNYIEKRPGATTADVETGTGVSQRSIRRMLREGRFMLSEDSKAMLYCDMCGKAIRYGRLCEECEKTAHRKLEELQRGINRNQNVKGYGLQNSSDDGHKRFVREK